MDNDKKNIFISCGFKEQIFDEWGEAYEFSYYEREDLPFYVWEDDGFIVVNIGMEYRIDESKIPLTEKNLNRLVKAFNP